MKPITDTQLMRSCRAKVIEEMIHRLDHAREWTERAGALAAAQASNEAIVSACGAARMLDEGAACLAKALKEMNGK